MDGHQKRRPYPGRLFSVHALHGNRSIIPYRPGLSSFSAPAWLFGGNRYPERHKQGVSYKTIFSSSIGCDHREDRHYRRIAAPAQAINSFGRWTYTLHGACATTFAATLPRKNRLSLVILRWPIMIMDTSSFSAKLMISS